MPEHLALPIRLEGNRLATIEQNSDDDIAQCVGVLLSTRRGERVELRGFGISDPTFGTTIDTGEIAAAIAEWEPRASRVVVDQVIDSIDEQLRTVTVERRPSDA